MRYKISRVLDDTFGMDIIYVEADSPRDARMKLRKMPVPPEVLALVYWEAEFTDEADDEGD